jgi:hypothetical protein
MWDGWIGRLKLFNGTTESFTTGLRCKNSKDLLSIPAVLRLGEAAKSFDLATKSNF